MIRWKGVVFVLVSALLYCAAVQAGERAGRENAPELATRGKREFSKGDYAGALVLLQRSYDLRRSAATGLYLARCQVALGRNARALLTYREVHALPDDSRAPRADRRAAATALEEMAVVREQVALVRVTVPGSAGYEVLVDDEAAEALVGDTYPVDPGRRLIAVQFDGSVQSRTLQVVAGEHYEVEFGTSENDVESAARPTGLFAVPMFAPDSFLEEEKQLRARRRSEEGVAAQQREETYERASERWETERDRIMVRRPWHRAGFVVLGVGGGALVVGGFAGLTAQTRKRDLGDRCDGRACPASAQGDLNDARHAARIATWSLVTSAVLVGAGVYLIIRGKRAASSTTEVGSVRLRLAPGGGRLEASF